LDCGAKSGGGTKLLEGTILKTEREGSMPVGHRSVRSALLHFLRKAMEHQNGSPDPRGWTKEALIKRKNSQKVM